MLTSYFVILQFFAFQLTRPIDQYLFIAFMTNVLACAFSVSPLLSRSLYIQWIMVGTINIQAAWNSLIMFPRVLTENYNCIHLHVYVVSSGKRRQFNTSHVFQSNCLNSKYCVIWIDWKWQNFINFIDIILNEVKDNSKLNRFNRLTFYQMTLTLAGRLTLLLLSICPPGALKMVQVGNM